MAKKTALVAKRSSAKVHQTARGWRIDVRFYVYEEEDRKGLEYWLAKVGRDLAAIWPIGGEEVDPGVGN